jgi:Ca-activated chloride channel family protein
MTASNENSDPANFDEQHDRLLDFALREVVGNETPSDLTPRILAANLNPAAASVAAPSPAVSPQPRTRRRAFWATLAVAAMLLVGTSIALLPEMQARRELSARKTSGRASSLSSAQESNSQNSPAVASKVVVGNEWSYSTRTPQSKESTETVLLDRSLSTVDRYSTISGEARTTAPVFDGKEGQQKSGVTRLAQRAAAEHARREDEVRFERTDSAVFPTETAPGALRQHSLFLDFYKKPQAQQNTGLQGLINDANAPMDAYGGGALTAEGIGPGLSGDQYTRIFENPFIKAEGANAVSTFSIDVDTASYSNVRQFLMEMNTLPPADAVRIEELVNYFDYDYAPPTDAFDHSETSAAPGSAGGSSDAGSDTGVEPAPFAAHVEVAGCPWAADHRLVRIGIKGREMDRGKRPQSNLVFLVDVSGSMNDPNKLPLVLYGLEQLTRELGENDRVAIVVYASREGLALPSTPGSDQATILSALRRLQAGGSTAGGSGIQLAYQIAEDHFIEGGTNRVILCTDGDFNVGVTSTAELERLCEEKAKNTKVFLSVLGFGRGNLNDAMMEAISNRGNGNYHYVDNRTEARRVLVEEMTGTLVTIAKDVKIQVEFNPRQVAGYRLIGYENRMLRTEDFNDDTKDAGEIGAGHTVTALYEVVPAGKPVDVPPVDDLKYQQPSTGQLESKSASAVEPQVLATGGSPETRPQPPSINSELLTLKMRYKQPEGDTSRKLDWAITDDGKAFGQASTDYQFAAAVAGFGLLLRDSQHKGNLTYAAALELAQAGLGSDEHGYRAEFVEMVRRAKSLRGE